MVTFERGMRGKGGFSVLGKTKQECFCEADAWEREGNLPSPRAGMSAPVLSLKVLVAIVLVVTVVMVLSFRVLFPTT